MFCTLCDYRLCSRGVTVCCCVLLLRLWVSLHNFKVTVAFLHKHVFQRMCVSVLMWRIFTQTEKKKEAHCDLREPFYLGVNGSAYQDVQKHLRYLLNNKLIRRLWCINGWSLKSCGLTPTTAARLFYSPAASVCTMTSYSMLIFR